MGARYAAARLISSSVLNLGKLMPIEFRCAECGKLLRVPDGTSGKEARCPACEATLTIPEPGVRSPAPSPPGEREDARSSPFAAGPSGPPAGGVGENPYQSPAAYAAGPMAPPPPPGYGLGRGYAAARVSGPAIWLIVTGAVGIPVKLLGIFGSLITIGVIDLGMGLFGDDPFMMVSGGVGLALDALGLILCFVVIAGAVKMKNLEHYGFAMAAAIIAMIPRVSPCCLLGLPFGIWAIVVLSEGPVKAAFRK